MNKESLIPKVRPPFLQLMVRAALWAPVALVITTLLLTSAVATVMLPIVALCEFYARDPTTGVLCLLGTIPTFFIARFLKRHFWEEPPSML